MGFLELPCLLFDGGSRAAAQVIDCTNGSPGPNMTIVIYNNSTDFNMGQHGNMWEGDRSRRHIGTGSEDASSANPVGQNSMHILGQDWVYVFAAFNEC